MTQPIQEPTSDRREQALAFRTRQLFRRPASSGGGAAAADLPYAWIRLTTNVSVASGSSFDTQTHTGNAFDAGDTSDSSIFAVDLANGRIQVKAEGIYQAYLEVFWTSTDMPQTTYLNLNTGSTVETGGGTRQSVHSNFAANSFQSWKNPASELLTIIDALAVTPTDNYFSLTAVNDNASSRTIDAIYLYVVKLSGVSGSAGASEQGWGSLFNLPVLELNMETNNHNASGATNFVIDNAYPRNGYIEQTSNNNWIEWVAQLGPQGSLWLPIPQFSKGPDFGKVTLQIASTPYVADLLGIVGSGGIESSGLPVTFVDVQTFDCYNATHDPYPTSPQVYNAFEITGADGAIGTAITGSNPWIWNGGAGAHFFRLKTNGQNASSTGFKKRISAFLLERVSNDMYA